MLGGRPLVLRPRDLADVRAAVHVAAAAGLSLSVRTDAQLLPMLAGEDGDVVLDLRTVTNGESLDQAGQLAKGAFGR